MATPSGGPTTLHTITELLEHPLVPIVSSMVAINFSAELVPLITVLVFLGDIVPRGYYCKFLHKANSTLYRLGRILLVRLDGITSSNSI